MTKININIRIDDLNIDDSIASARAELLEDLRNDVKAFSIKATPEEYRAFLRETADKSFRNVLIEKRVSKAKFEVRFRKMKPLYGLIGNLLEHWDELYEGNSFGQFRRALLTTVMATDLAHKEYSGTNSPQYRLFDELFDEIESEINND